MERLKIFSLLQKLKKDELKDFHKFLKRNHPREKIALAVLEYIVIHQAEPNKSGKLDPEQMYAAAFKSDYQKDLNSRKSLLNTLSDLYNWLKEFLIARKANEDEFIRESVWLEVLKEKRLEVEHERKALQFFQSEVTKSFNGWKNALPLLNAGYYYFNSMLQNKPQFKAEAIRSCHDLLVKCWEVIRIRQECEIQLATYIAKTSKSNLPAIDFPDGIDMITQVYNTMLKLLESKDVGSFIKMEEILTRFGHQIVPQELRDLILSTQISIAIQSRKQKNLSVNELAHRLNIIGLQFGAFTQNGNISSPVFGNIVTMACQAGDFDWASQFIRENSISLAESTRAEGVLLAQAAWDFEKGNFSKVLDTLEKERPSFKLQLDNYRAKTLLLRSYYELGAHHFEIIEECLRLEAILRSGKMTPPAQATFNFVKLVKLLATQKSKKEMIIKRIEQAEPLYAKSWLLEKAQAYRPKYAPQKNKD